jgi:hypothetical protein
MDTGHNISPRLRKQLVLELKVGVKPLKILKKLPRCLLWRQTLPLDKNMPRSTPLRLKGWSWS